MTASPYRAVRYRIDLGNNEAQRILERLDHDNLVRAHGRYTWASDGTVESYARIARLRKIGVLRLVGGLIARVPG